MGKDLNVLPMWLLSEVYTVFRVRHVCGLYTGNPYHTFRAVEALRTACSNSFLAGELEACSCKIIVIY